MAERDAECVLNMPEMEAVRRILSDVLAVLAHSDDPVKQQAEIAHLDESWVALPETVKAWVLNRDIRPEQ